MVKTSMRMMDFECWILDLSTPTYLTTQIDLISRTLNLKSLLNIPISDNGYTINEY